MLQHVLLRALHWAIQSERMADWVAALFLVNISVTNSATAPAPAPQKVQSLDFGLDSTQFLMLGMLRTLSVRLLILGKFSRQFGWGRL